MDESISWQFDDYLQEVLNLKEVDISSYSPLDLAYIGDCIYDLIIKTMVMNGGMPRYKSCTRRPAAWCKLPPSLS